MALISCPKCGQNISDAAYACPHCGSTPNSEKNNGAIKQFPAAIDGVKGKYIAIGLVGLLILIAIVSSFSSSTKADRERAVAENAKLTESEIKTFTEYAVISEVVNKQSEGWSKEIDPYSTFVHINSISRDGEDYHIYGTCNLHDIYGNITGKYGTTGSSLNFEVVMSELGVTKSCRLD